MTTEGGNYYFYSIKIAAKEALILHMNRKNNDSVKLGTLPTHHIGEVMMLSSMLFDDARDLKHGTR